jgi:hypothetical protein
MMKAIVILEIEIKDTIEKLYNNFIFITPLKNKLNNQAA